MSYEDVNMPKELLDFMKKNIKYGFVDSDGKVYDALDDEEFPKRAREKWRLSSPKRLLNVQYGTCWDQVELERDWFSNHNYNFKTIYIWFLFPYENSYSTHAYLVYEKNGKWYYFEHSDFGNQGIYTFDTYEDAIYYQMEKHIKNNETRNPVGKEELKRLRIYEYVKPLYGCSMEEFIDHILENAKEIIIDHKCIKKRVEIK